MPAPAPRRLDRKRALPALLLAITLLGGCDSSEERAQTYYNRGLATLAAGELDKAAVDLRNALKLKEDFTDAQMALGEVEEGRSNFDSAARLYLAVAERNPQNLEARVRLARLLLASRQIEAASIYAEQGNKLAPADPRVLVIRAGVALSRGDRGEAARLAGEALRIEPGNTTAIMLLASERVAASDPAGALKIAEEGLIRNEADLRLELLKLRTLEALGDMQEIERQYTRLAERFPNSPELQAARLKWYFARGRGADAESAARGYARANADDAAAQIQFASVVSRTRGAAAAAEELKAIIADTADARDGRLVALKTALAQLQSAAGQREAAVVTLKDCLAAARGGEVDEPVRVRLAHTLAATGMWGEAEVLSAEILGRAPGNVGALTVRAMARMAGGDNAGAVEDLFAALDEAPNSASLALLMGEAHERMGSPELAEQQYARALALSGHLPSNGLRLAKLLMRYGRSAKAMQVLEDLRLRGTASRASLSLLAQLKLNAGDRQGAQELAERLRSMKASGESGIQDQIPAIAPGEADDHDQQMDEVRAKSPGAPNQQDAKASLARAHLRAGRLADAEKLLRELLDDQPSSAQWQVLLGSVLIASERTAEAEAVLRKAVAGGEGGASADEALAKFYLRSGRPAEAEQVARAGLARYASASALRLLLAQSLEARGAGDAAIAEYEALSRSDPTSTIVANNLASLLSEKHDDPEALERAYRIASRFRNSGVPQFLDTLGWIHYLRGEYHEALPLLTRAAQKLPDYGAVQFHLGMVLKQIGNADLSANALQRAVNLAPQANADYLKTATAALKQMTPVASD